MKLQNARGYSAIEILFVLGLVAIMSAVGFGSTRNAMPRYQTTKAAAEFSQTVSLARQLAITNGVETRVLLVEFDTALTDPEAPNKGMYRIQLGNYHKSADMWDTLPFDPGPTDSNYAEGTHDLSIGSQDYLKGVSIQDWGTIAGPGTGNTDAIVFNSRGYLQNPPSDMDTAGGIPVTFTNKLSQGGADVDATTVRIYSGGMIRTFKASAEVASMPNEDTDGGVGAPVLTKYDYYDTY